MYQRMNALEFQAAMALRLLMPLFPCEKECLAQSCTRPMDIYGYHALACHGKLMINRHNLLRDALYDLCSMARFHPVKDADVHCLGTRNNGTSATFRPADLLIAGDDFHQDCVDVTVRKSSGLCGRNSNLSHYKEYAGPWLSDSSCGGSGEEEVRQASEGMRK
jgi:hypothetical protein